MPITGDRTLEKAEGLETVAGAPGNLQSQTLNYSLQLQVLMKMQIHSNRLKAFFFFWQNPLANC